MSKSHTPGSAGKGLLTVILCSLLVLFTLAALAAVGLYSACNLVLNGPSESARDSLTISLLKSDATAWIPPLFLDEQELALAQWHHRDALPAKDDGISLTREMIRTFEEGREPVR